MDPESYLPRPSKPLKILTIDGGGLQAISTLLILDETLTAIAKKDPQLKKPRPCDIFDTIAGIGCGGWLAILLGRFHMDIAACLTEWYNLMEAIEPNSKTAGFKYRMFRQCYYDPDRLTTYIQRLTKIYGTGENMIDDSHNKPRCRHVFVAALEERDTKPAYNLFRTYRCQPKPAPNTLRAGPLNPEEFKIWRAFCVTGAARYFAPTWQETMDNGKRSKFRDTKFPFPHNITDIALDEMWGLYGSDVPISVVVNIGPGLPNKSDIIKLISIISWPASLSSRRSTSSSVSRKSTKEGQFTSGGSVEEHHVSVGPRTSAPGSQSAKSNESIKVDDRDIEKKLQRREEEIEQDIVRKLTDRYGKGRVPYFRLALETSADGAPRNDSRNPKRSSIAVDQWYLSHQTKLERMGQYFNQLKAAGE